MTTPNADRLAALKAGRDGVKRAGATMTNATRDGFLALFDEAIERIERLEQGTGVSAPPASAHTVSSNERAPSPDSSCPSCAARLQRFLDQPSLCTDPRHPGQGTGAREAPAREGTPYPEPSPVTAYVPNACTVPPLPLLADHKGTTYPDGKWKCQACGEPWPCNSARISKNLDSLAPHAVLPEAIEHALLALEHEYSPPMTRRLRAAIADELAQRDRTIVGLRAMLANRQAQLDAANAQLANYGSARNAEVRR